MVRHSKLLMCLALVLLGGCAMTSPNSGPFVGTHASGISTSNSTVSTGPESEGSNAAPPAAALQVVQLKTQKLQTVDLTAHADDVWDRIRTGFAIPNMTSPLVVEHEIWYQGHQESLRRAVERSSHYLYHVVEELEKRGLPTELALLPFVESDYNPMAYSRAHASGMWQFIPTTGKTYNLRQDWWHDERRDVIASTDAALNYLEMLYEMHGDWTLALASYNWGEGAVKRAIDRNAAANRPTDYLSLNMPEETRNYYPKLQALKNIIADPAAFGVILPRIDNQPYFVSVPSTRDIDVRTAAQLANMPIEDFKALNASFNRPLISASGASTLLLPADRVELFESNLQGHAEPLSTWMTYTAQRGERLDHVAAKFGMTVASLCDANSLSARARLRPGQALLVQRRSAPALVAAMAPAPTPRLQDKIVRASFTPPAQTRAPVAIYSVRRGDSLFSIAKHFGTSVDALRAQNGLDTTSLSLGQKLSVPATLGATLAATSAPAPARTQAH